jgi:glutaredoxin-related protein
MIERFVKNNFQWEDVDRKYATKNLKDFLKTLYR